MRLRAVNVAMLAAVFGILGVPAASAENAGNVTGDSGELATAKQYAQQLAHEELKLGEPVHVSEVAAMIGAEHLHSHLHSEATSVHGQLAELGGDFVIEDRVVVEPLDGLDGVVQIDVPQLSDLVDPSVTAPTRPAEEAGSHGMSETEGREPHHEGEAADSAEVVSAQDQTQPGEVEPEPQGGAAEDGSDGDESTAAGADASGGDEAVADRQSGSGAKQRASESVFRKTTPGPEELAGASLKNSDPTVNSPKSIAQDGREQVSVPTVLPERVLQPNGFQSSDEGDVGAVSLPAASLIALSPEADPNPVFVQFRDGSEASEMKADSWEADVEEVVIAAGQNRIAKGRPAYQAAPLLDPSIEKLTLNLLAASMTVIGLAVFIRLLKA